MKHFSQEEKEKQWTESRKSRVEREFFLHNLENREEKENCFKNLTNREEKEDCCLKILKIEKWKRNENTILQLEWEKYESFLLEIFSRSRLLSMTALQCERLSYRWFPFLLCHCYSEKSINSLCHCHSEKSIYSLKSSITKNDF